MTKAVIDGPVRHQDQHGLWLLGIAAMGVGIAEAVLWFIRRWLVARGTMGVEADIRKDLYARLQILPMSFHGRWQSGQLLSRIMNDLSTIRRFMSFGMVFLLLNIAADHRGDGDPARDVLAARCGRAGLDRADHRDGAALPAGVHPAVAAGAGPVRSRRHPRRGVGARPAGDQVVRPRATTSTTGSTGSSPISTTRRSSRVSVSAKFWTLLEVIPNLTLIIVLGLGAYAAGQGYVTMGTLVAFITMMLSLVWPIASLGFLLSMTQESFTAANRIAEIFDAPREIADGPGADGAARRPARTRSTSASGSPDRSRRLGAAARQPHRRARGDARPRRRRRDRASRCWPRCCRGSTTSPRARSASTASTSATCRCPRCARRWPPRSRTRRCSRCRSPRTSRLGRPHATEDELAQAIEVAAAQFVYDLPFGLDTRIGEQGMSLSGGQRQRLSLARAILADAEDPGARRHPLGARHAHRGRRRGGAAPGAARGDRHRRGAPRVDRAARRQGRAARRTAPSPTSARMPSCWRRCRSTATCWPPTTNSTTAPSGPAPGRTTRTAAGSAGPRGAGGHRAGREPVDRDGVDS